MKHHLIEVPENFHNDEVPFNDPAELDKIMTALEDENLKMIDRLTDTAQLIEKEEIREMWLREDQGNLKIKLEQNLNDLKKRKEENQSVLRTLRNKSNFTGFTEKLDVAGTGRMQGQMVTIEKVVDVDQMIRDLKQRIDQTYKEDLDANEVQLTDDDPPLELLQTLEQKIVQRQAKIEERRKPTLQRPTAAEEIKRFEIQQKAEFKKER